MEDIYFNDNEPYVAQWLRNLWPAATVDERSVTELDGTDLSNYRRVHLFAGIGGWEYALQLAGWPSDVPVWTGSCPCQPFSVAGEKQGFQDARHLWPSMFRLIRECRPEYVFGEQVARAIGFGWLDNVSTDLEAKGYTVGAVVLGAHSVNATHIRQRLYWVAYSSSARRERLKQQQCFPRSTESPQSRSMHSSAVVRYVVESDPALVRIDDGLSVGVGRSRIKGYGNAIVPQVAAEFIRAFMEASI